MSTNQHIIIGALLCITFIIGAGAGYLFFANRESALPESSQRLDSDSYRFTNPLIDERDSANPALLNSEMRELKEKIEAITQFSIQSGIINHGSVYYRDLNNGPWIYTGDAYDYKPASLFKVPLMIAFFKEAERRPDLLQQQVLYETLFENIPEQNIAGSEATIEVGQTYTIAELIERMIINSDNSAAHLLLKHIDSQVVTSVFRDLDVPIEGIENSITPFGPRSYASFLRILYNGTYLNKEYSEKALELLSRTNFAHGMRAVLKEDTRASIKFGIAVNPDGSRQLHECGIVYWQANNPYLLCIMTNGRDYNEMSSFIQSVTKEVQSTISRER